MTLAVNGASSTLQIDITPTSTTLTVAPGDANKFPATGTFRCLIQNSLVLPSKGEIVDVTSVASNVFTVTRSVEEYAGNATAYDWVAGDFISQVITPQTISGVALPAKTTSNLALTVACDSVSANFNANGYCQVNPSSAALAPFQGGNWSVVFWGNPSPGVWNGMVVVVGNGGTDGALQIGRKPNVVVAFNNDDWDTGVPDVQGLWNCYVITYDASTKTRQFSLNGANFVSAVSTGVLSIPNASPLTITYAYPAAYWVGNLAHFATFSGTLSQATATDWYNNAFTMTESQYETYTEGLNPLLYYTFQETSGSAIINHGSTGTGDNLSIVPTVGLDQLNGPIRGNTFLVWR